MCIHISPKAFLHIVVQKVRDSKNLAWFWWSPLAQAALVYGPDATVDRGSLPPAQLEAPAYAATFRTSASRPRRT